MRATYLRKDFGRNVCTSDGVVVQGSVRISRRIRLVRRLRGSLTDAPATHKLASNGKLVEVQG